MMSQPLPWMDTGLLASYEHRARARLFSRVGNRVFFGEVAAPWSLRWETDFASPFVECTPGNFEQDRVLNLYTAAGIFEIERRAACTALDWSAEYEFIESAGLFRVGAAVETPGSGFLGQRLLYGLFRDEDTAYLITWAGQSENGTFGSPPVGPGGTPQGPDYLMKGFRFAVASSVNSGNVEIEIRGLSVNGEPVDVSGLADGTMTGTAPGSVDAVANGLATDETAYPSYQWRLNVEAHDSAGNAVAAEVTPAYGDDFTTPALVTITRRANTWDSLPPDEGGFTLLTQSLRLQTAWADAQDPPIHTLDRTIPFRAAPKNPLTREVYQPLALSFAATLDVLPSANAWVAHAGPVAASGAGGNTWTVTGAGAQVRRTLVERWRNWTGLAVGGTGDPLYDPLRHWTTKHDYYADSPGQDVWSWGQYAYLELTITAPQAGTLTLQIDGAHLTVSNAYTSQPGLFSAGAVPFGVSYNVEVAAGTGVYRVDLLFPASGGPFFYGRVDTITVSGLAAGVYTLAALRLRAIEDGYLKVDQDRLGNICSLVVAQDGAFTFGNTTDDFLKDDEIGEFGGSLPWKLPATAFSAPVRTLADYWEDLARTEGFQASYSAGASDAFLKDAFGTRLYFLISGADAEQSGYVEPIMPHARYAAGVTVAPLCSAAVDEVRIPNGIGAVMLYARAILGGVLEAQVSRDGTSRALAGTPVQAVRTDTSVTVAVAYCDASGYVAIPVRGCDDGREFRLDV